MYLSVVIEPDVSILPFLTPLAAVATRRAIKEEFGIDTGIKWVNDLFTLGPDPKKVCVILTEAVTTDITRAIVGIGINVYHDKADYDGVTIAGSLIAGDIDYDRLKKLAKNVVNNLQKCCEKYKNAIDEYISASCIIGEEVIYSDGNNCYDAVVRNIDTDCGLIIKTNDFEKKVFDGEITWKRLL